MFTIALGHLLAHGVRLEPHEAVAIAQDLMAHPAGIPAPGNIQLTDEGSASCVDAQGTPSVFDAAALLQALLPPGTTRVPPALRYAIARGLRAVEAPPFESLADFSRALQRFEAGERREIVRSLLKRIANAPRSASGSPAAADRRPAPAPRPTAAARRSTLAPEYGSLDLMRPDVPAFDGVVPVPPVRRRLWLPAAAAVFVSFAAGFALMEHIGEPKTRTGTRAEHGGPDAARSAPVAVRPDPAAAASIPAPVAPDLSAAPERAVATSGRRVERVPLSATDQSAFSPAFGANGTAIFFHTGGNRDPRSAIEVATSDKWPGGDLGIMTVVDDGARNYHAQPSPDGRFVAFDSDRDGQRAVFVANRDGSNVRRISGNGYAAAPTWSPDGARLAFIRAETGRPAVWNLWVQPVNGSQPTRLTNHRYGQTWTASWFPDNRRVAYTHEDKVIVLDLETGRASEFASPVKGRAVRTPAVSPDGSTIIFQVFRHGAWLLDLGDGSMRCVLEDPTAEEFAWAPDGRRVAFHSRRDGRWGIYLLSRG